MRKEMKSKSLLFLVFLFLAFLTSVGGALAQTAEARAAQVKELASRSVTRNSDVYKVKPMDGAAQIYEFLLNERVVMRYRTMSQGLSARERALIIGERANKLGQKLQEGTVAVACIEGSFAVTLDNQLFITVTEADFKANNSTGAGLAEVWAENLRTARLGGRPAESRPAQEQAEIQKEIEAPKGSSAEEAVDEDRTTVAAQELKMLELINEERAKAGVKPLLMKPELVRIARLKSQEMIDKDYFNHTSPTYGDPFTMMKKLGIEYGYAGENLAGNPSVENAHESLMASSGHKKNILNPNYTHVGIGIVEGGPYGQMFTQLFISES